MVMLLHKPTAYSGVVQLGTLHAPATWHYDEEGRLVLKYLGGRGDAAYAWHDFDLRGQLVSLKLPGRQPVKVAVVDIDHDRRTLYLSFPMTRVAAEPGFRR